MRPVRIKPGRKTNNKIAIREWYRHNFGFVPAGWKEKPYISIAKLRPNMKVRYGIPFED